LALTVSILNQPQTQKFIKLFDISGKLINSFELEPKQDNLLIGMDSLFPGIFIIRVSYDSEIYNKTLI